jgi:hypothetical protein
VKQGEGVRKLRYCCGLHTSVYNLPKYLFIIMSTGLKHEPIIQLNPDLHSLKCSFLRKKKSCSVHTNFYSFITGKYLLFTYVVFSLGNCKFQLSR